MSQILVENERDAARKVIEKRSLEGLQCRRELSCMERNTKLGVEDGWEENDCGGAHCFIDRLHNLVALCIQDPFTNPVSLSNS